MSLASEANDCKGLETAHARTYKQLVPFSS
jgi:hypothetical protein